MRDFLLRLTVLLALCAPGPARALFHVAVIDEVMTSYGGDANIQFVEIRMLEIVQNVVTNTVLSAFDADGNFVDDVFIVPANVPNSGAGVRWIMGTSEFAAVSELTPDFVIPAGLPVGGGMICWGAPGIVAPPDTSWDRTNFANNWVDCVAYGSYSGPSNVRIGTPTPLDADGHSLRRVSDTDDNAADFACGDPADPMNNAGAPEEMPATTPCELPPVLEDPIASGIPTGSITLSLQTLTENLTAPNWGTPAPGDAVERLFVTDQPGRVLAIDLGSGEPTLFLDVSSRLVSLGVLGPGSFDERGLLGLAFHPDYASNGLLYTYTSEPVGGPADFTVSLPAGVPPNHQSVVNEWQVPEPGNPASVVDPGSVREVLRIDEPQFNHDGGALVFGPDRLLYIALGDGGNGDDQGPGHGLQGNGQDTSNVLGSILRIDVDARDSANGAYGVPDDNPFVGVEGVDEIYAYGLRNPFRISFDSETGELLIADVGQGDLEEVDLGVKGGNYGWNHKEGSFFFVPNGNDPGFVTDVDPGVPAGLIDPIAEYDHDEGTAIIGGFVYRGAGIPELVGRYVFGDFSGRLFYLDQANQVTEFALIDPPALGRPLLGFGQDAEGELYALVNETATPFGQTGAVLRLVNGAQPEVRAFRTPGTVRLRNTSSGGNGSIRNKTLTVVARLADGTASRGATASASVQLLGVGGSSFHFDETQTGVLQLGGGGAQFKFSVPFQVSGCDATPDPGGAPTAGVVAFTATVRLDGNDPQAADAASVNLLCKP